VDLGNDEGVLGATACAALVELKVDDPNRGIDQWQQALRGFLKGGFVAEANVANHAPWEVPACQPGRPQAPVLAS
jgi:hypothetical protein